MNTIKKTIIGIALISIFLIPFSAQMTSAENPEIGVSNQAGVITITTEKITIKVTPNQANILWWFGNDTTQDEMYKFQLLKIREFIGADDVLDSQTELVGLNYNLITGSWIIDILEEETEVTITLSLTGLANGADVYLIMHVYNTDTPINGTDQIVDALSELKFDIIVDNWDFSPTAKGIAIETYLTEVQHRHRVEVRNGTVAENGNTTRTLQYQSASYDEPVAYFEWAEFASIYNSSDDLIDTIDVGTAYFDDLASPPTEAPGFAEGLAHLWLTYPNYGDNYKMVHDPSIGVNEDSFTATASLYLLPIIGGLIAIPITIIIIKKRKN